MLVIRPFVFPYILFSGSIAREGRRTTFFIFISLPFHGLSAFPGSVENQWGLSEKLKGKRILFYGKRISQSNSMCSVTDTNDTLI